MCGEPALRFGILCRDPALAAWQIETIAYLLAVDGVVAALLIVDERIASSRERQCALWRWYAALFRAEGASSQTQLDAIPRLRCAGDTFGDFRAEEIAAIRSHALDFILDFGSEPLTGDLLSVPRYGVWSFVVDGSDNTRRDPPCFWAIYADRPTIHVTLQRRSAVGDHPTTLRQGDFKNSTHAYGRTVAHMRLGATRWPAQVCREIQQGAASEATNAPALPVAWRAAPTNVQVLGFILKVAWRFARTVWAALFRHDQWNIGIVEAPIETFLSADERPPVRWLPKPQRNHFLADPFAASDGTLFVEEFDYRTRKGRIAALTMAGDGVSSPPRPVLALPVHLSYPYLIHHQGDVYCVPESGEAGEIALYKATAFPERWTKCMTLVAGFAGLDATLFPHDGRWWLVCTEQGDYSNTMLHAWHAPDLFGPWTPHPGNPLKTDVRSSRPAGAPFVHGGHLYRPTQDCSRTYGGAVTINRIERLSPTAFAEETVAVVTPDTTGPYRYGLHTLSAFGPYTLIDGKGRSFAPAEFRRLIGTLLRRIRQRAFRR